MVVLLLVTGLIAVLLSSNCCFWDCRRIYVWIGGGAGGGASSMTMHVGGGWDGSIVLNPSSCVAMEIVPEELVDVVCK